MITSEQNVLRRCWRLVVGVSILAATVTKAGPYKITISGFDGATGPYTVLVRDVLAPSRVSTDFNVLLFDPDGAFLGGVIAPGETVMVVVPGSDHLVVEVKVAPQDIDQLRHGQNAVLRFSAFNQRTTPELTGEISRISADLITDQRTGQSHYTVRIAIPESEPARLGDLRLTPGMPVEAFMLTQPRTVLTYFTKPLSDQIVRAFRGR